MKIDTPVLSKNDMADFIDSFDWHYWCTFTTRLEMTLKSARRMAQGMDKFLSSSYNWTMFWAAEPFDIKEGHHLHAVIRMSDVHSFQKIIGTWQVISGNKTMEKGDKWNRVQIEQYDKKLGAGHYISKYITKELADYDFYSNKTLTRY